MPYSHISNAFLLLFVFLILDYIRTIYRPVLRKLPGPVLARASSFARILHVWSGDVPMKELALHQQYGPIVRIGPNHVSVSDPDAIHIIYGTGSKATKTSFYDAFTSTHEGKQQISQFATRDPIVHKQLKSAVASKFSMTSIRTFEPMADECSQIFIASMHDLAGQPVDLSAWLQWYAFDVIGSITFQRRFGFMEQRKDVDGTIKALDIGMHYASVVGQIPGLHWWLFGNERLQAAAKWAFPGIRDPRAKIFNMTEDQMRLYDTEKHDESRGDFLAWLRAEQVRAPGRLSDNDLYNHIASNLFAGSDTTAISLRAIFYYLLKNPTSYRKLMNEIQDCERIGKLSESVTYEQCLEMPYLQAVIKEAVRLTPAVGYPLERSVPTEGLHVCGYQLPGGTTIGINPFVIHRDPVFGADVEVFRPERWIDSHPEQLRLMERCYGAFGWGARMCMGKNISILEMGKFVPQVLRHFDFEWASESPEWHISSYFFSKQSGLICRMTPKKSKLGG